MSSLLPPPPGAPLPPQPGSTASPPNGQPRRRVPRLAIAAAAVIALVGVALGAWAVVRSTAWKNVTQGASDALQDAALGRDARRDARGRIVAEGRMSPLRLQRGDCFRETRSPSPSASASASVFEADEVIGLPCNDPHDFEVYFTADLPEGAFPGQASVVSTTESRCAAAFESFVGVPYDDSTLEIIYFFPSAQTWARAGDRQMTCAATDGSTIGTLADARH